MALDMSVRSPVPASHGLAGGGDGDRRSRGGRGV